MATKKQYNEQEVLEKAMMLFWKKGYKNTSVRMLEKEMGINQFSIYSSFKSKELLFAKCLKKYHETVGIELINLLKNSSNSIEGIRKYFNQFLDKTYIENKQIGCFMVNTMQDAVLGIKEASEEIERFKSSIEKHVLIKTNQESILSTTEKENLLQGIKVSLYGFSTASRIFPKNEMLAFIDRILAI
jgi:TetR/AcrR family transcriptional regulator, transcriptional repressor for nem operon